MELLLHDWIAALVTVFVALGVVGTWGWALTRNANPERPSTYVPHLFMLIIITAVGGGIIALAWGGRAYFMAHRTEANNVAAAEREREVMQTPDMDVDLVTKIRKELDEKKKRDRLEKERRELAEARQKSDDYLRSLEGKEKKE
jgi:hypothetical protein